MTKKGQSEDCP